MNTNFFGQHALVTGGTSGIGQAIARALATEGCDVTVTGRTEAEVEAFHASGLAVKALPLEVTDQRAVERVVSTMGEISRSSTPVFSATPPKAKAEMTSQIVFSMLPMPPRVAS